MEVLQGWSHPNPWELTTSHGLPQMLPIEPKDFMFALLAFGLALFPFFFICVTFGVEMSILSRRMLDAFNFLFICTEAHLSICLKSKRRPGPWNFRNAGTIRTLATLRD